MTIVDYAIKFEQLYFKTKSIKMEILNGTLTYMLLNSVKIYREQKQLVKATVSQRDCNIMKNKFRQVVTNNVGDLLPQSNLSEEKIKVETSHDVYYAK